MVALADEDLSCRSIDIDNFNSEFHSWPHIAQRRVAQGKATPVPSGPLVAELRRVQRLLAEYQRHIDLDAVASRDATIVHLRDQIDQGTAERVRLEARIEAGIRELGARDDQLRRVRGVEGAFVNLWRAVGRRVTGRP